MHNIIQYIVFPVKYFDKKTEKIFCREKSGLWGLIFFAFACIIEEIRKKAEKDDRGKVNLWHKK